MRRLFIRDLRSTLKKMLIQELTISETLYWDDIYQKKILLQQIKSCLRQETQEQFLLSGTRLLDTVFYKEHSYAKNAKKYNKLYTTEKSMKLMENSFERQANTFAANVVAPRNYVYCIFVKLFGSRRKIRFCGAGRYSLCFNNISWFVYANSPFELACVLSARLHEMIHCCWYRQLWPASSA